MKHIYPAVFYNEGNGYSVLFPDFDCGTCGDNLQQAYEMAIDFLYSQLSDCIESKKQLPKPTDMSNIEYSTDFEYNSCFATLVAVDIEEYEKYLEKSSKAVRKNITIPAWLSEKADQHHINYSSLLQEALRRKLQV